MGRRFVVRKCLECKNEFNACNSEINRGNGKFCSRSCSSIFENKEKRKNIKPNVFCALCGKNFYKCESQKSKPNSGLHFCCRSHKDQSQKIGGIIAPDHYGKGVHANYRLIAFANKDPKCERCGWDRHISGIVIHHKNRNRLDNSIENLEVLCACCHAIEHWSRD